MKSTTILKFALIAVIAIACSPSTSDQTTSGDSTASASDAIVEKPVSVVTWNEIGVHATPEEKGKYVTSIYLGEHIALAGDTASEKAGSKRNHYHKVVLTDGKTGWVRDEFIGIEVFPAVIMQESQILKRPDIATVTEKKFSRGDFVTVKNKTGEYLEVTGRPTGEKWFTTGYIKATDLSYADVEIQYATLMRRANEETKQNVKDALLSQINDETLFGNSQLWIEDNTEPAYHSEYNRGTMEFGSLPDGLVVHLTLNLANADDESGKDNNGTMFGEIDFVQDGNGFPQGAAELKGTQYIAITNNSGDANLTLPFTIASYFMVDDITHNNQWLLTRGLGPDDMGIDFGFNQNDAGILTYEFSIKGTYNHVAYAPATMKADEWVLLAASVDESGNMTLFVNGEVVSEQTIEASEIPGINAKLANSKLPIEIGRWASENSSYFNGYIVNVAIWNRALTKEEVKALVY